MREKICFIIPSVKSGGLEVFLLRFLHFLNGEYEVTLIARSTVKGELYEEFRKLEIDVFLIPLGYLNIAKCIKYYQIFKKGQFDTVCDMNANFAGLPMLIAKLAGVKNRVAYYGQASDHFSKSFFKTAYNKFVNILVKKFASSIPSNSMAALNYFFPGRSIEDKRFVVIPNGIDVLQFATTTDKIALRKELGLKGDAFIVGHTGRLDKAKNHKTILDVAAVICSANPEIEFLLCGRDTELLQTRVNDLGLENNVRLLGYRPDVHRLLHAMDMFYFPSLTEGQPNSLIEAMIAGLPFVASNIPAIQEMIPEQLQSRLVDPYDIKSVVQMINELKTNKNLRKSLTCSAWAIQYFDSNLRFKQFQDLL